MYSKKNFFKTINYKHNADIFMADEQKIPTTGIVDMFSSAQNKMGIII